MGESKSCEHLHNCSLPSSEMVIFSPEINSYSNAIITKNSHRGHESMVVSDMSCNAAQTLPNHGFMWWDCSFVYFIKSMNFGFKVPDAVICLLITVFSPETACIVSSPTVFGPNCMVWALQSSIPHLSSSFSSLEIKLLEKAWVISWFVYFIYFHMTQHQAWGKIKK